MNAKEHRTFDAAWPSGNHNEIKGYNGDKKGRTKFASFKKDKNRLSLWRESTSKESVKWCEAVKLFPEFLKSSLKMETPAGVYWHEEFSHNLVDRLYERTHRHYSWEITRDGSEVDKIASFWLEYFGKTCVSPTWSSMISLKNRQTNKKGNVNTLNVALLLYIKALSISIFYVRILNF